MTQYVMSYGRNQNLPPRPAPVPNLNPVPATTGASTAAVPALVPAPAEKAPPAGSDDEPAAEAADAEVSRNFITTGGSDGAVPTGNLSSGRSGEGVPSKALAASNFGNPDLGVTSTGNAGGGTVSGSDLGGGGGGGGFVPRGGATSFAPAGTTGSSNTAAFAPAVAANVGSGTSAAPGASSATGGSGQKTAGNSGTASGTGQESGSTSNSSSGGGSGQGAGTSVVLTAKAPDPNNGTPGGPGTNTEPASGTGELHTATYASTIASNTSGVLGSQPGSYTMGDDQLIPAMILDFGDPNDDVKNWIYYPGENQNAFPTTATIAEGFGAVNGNPLCAVAPKGCEGRILRWFDLGLMPATFTDIRAYLPRLHNGKLKKEEISTKVSYWDFAIGARNQITLPSIPMRLEHVYYVVMMPEGAPVAIVPMEMNLEDTTQYEQFLAMVANAPIFVRGIQVKGQFLQLLYTVPTNATTTVPTSNLRTAPGGGK